MLLLDCCNMLSQLIPSQDRNMTTPECDAAQIQTVPGPRKPENFKVRSISDVVARQLVSLANGSREFELLLSSTDVYCTIGGDSTGTQCAFPSLQWA